MERQTYNEDLDVFLALAEELQLKGRAGSKGNTDKEPKDIPKQPEHLKGVDTKLEPSYQLTYTKEQEGYVNTIVDFQTLEPVDSSKMVALAEISNEDLRVKIASMIDQVNDGEYKWKCTVCGKANKKKQDMERHI